MIKGTSLHTSYWYNLLLSILDYMFRLAVLLEQHCFVCIGLWPWLVRNHDTVYVRYIYTFIR